MQSQNGASAKVGKRIWVLYIVNLSKKCIRYVPDSFPSVLYHNYCVHYDIIEPMFTDFDRITQILHVSADVLDQRVVQQFSSSKYIIITDYEHLFSEGFEAKVRSVASRRLAERPQTMLAYRIFEVDDNVEVLPRNKSELMKLFTSNKAVVFHSKYYPGAHDINGLIEWFAKNGTADGLFAKDQKFDEALKAFKERMDKEYPRTKRRCPTPER
ncbi:hypothetical protein TELCIR_14097 [Teladorsagia circumcincta]|uniref:Uncharacterized protein n=1 Tax=Teladorsagia circumcincta TaxID=45464 RepID=A0A2G9U3L4_TELCI|nr:hypothetical protein TELCIR_14097 [Teladorsagia circumcincta]